MSPSVYLVTSIPLMCTKGFTVQGDLHRIPLSHPSGLRDSFGECIDGTRTVVLSLSSLVDLNFQTLVDGHSGVFRRARSTNEYTTIIFM